MTLQRMFVPFLATALFTLPAAASPPEPTIRAIKTAPSMKGSYLYQF